MTPDQVYPVLEVSTAHVTRETMQAIERKETVGVPVIAVYDGGAFLYVPVSLGDVAYCPPDLIRVLAVAAAQECRLLRLDRDAERFGGDADVAPALPVYEWA